MMKNAEKLLMPVLAMVAMGIWAFCFGNFEVSMAGVAGAVTLLAVFGLLLACRRLNAPWKGVVFTVWFLFAVVVVGWLGPAFFAADALIYSEACSSFGLVHLWLAFLALLWLADRRFSGGRGIENAIFAGVLANACMFAACGKGEFFGTMFENVACIVTSAAVLGALIWRTGCRESLARYVRVVVYPVLSFLLVMGIIILWAACNRLAEKREARQRQGADPATESAPAAVQQGDAAK